MRDVEMICVCQILEKIYVTHICRLCWATVSYKIIVTFDFIIQLNKGREIVIFSFVQNVEGLRNIVLVSIDGDREILIS